MTTVPPALERRTGPRPVPAPSGFVQALMNGDAQWACAFCGRHAFAPRVGDARAQLEQHLAEDHAGWALQAHHSRSQPRVDEQPARP